MSTNIETTVEAVIPYIKYSEVSREEFIDVKNYVDSLVKYITWDDLSNMNNFTTAGIYEITGERKMNKEFDNLPIDNSGGGHTISARLEVLDSSIDRTTNSDDKCITQKLTLSNRVGGDGNVYIRTGRGKSYDSITWEKWGALQTNINVGQVASLDDLKDNGIYSGVWLQGHYNSYPLTFVCVVINDYFIGIAPRRISQFVYGLSKFDGSVIYQSRIWDDSKDKWGDWEILNKNEITSMISEEIKMVTDGIDPEKIDSIKDIVAWIDAHGGDVTAIYNAITAESQRAKDAEQANTYAIGEEEFRAIEAEKRLKNDIDYVNEIVGIEEKGRLTTDIGAVMEDGSTYSTNNSAYTNAFKGGDIAVTNEGYFIYDVRKVSADGVAEMVIVKSRRLRTEKGYTYQLNISKDDNGGFSKNELEDIVGLYNYEGGDTSEIEQKIEDAIRPIDENLNIIDSHIKGLAEKVKPSVNANTLDFEFDEEKVHLTFSDIDEDNEESYDVLLPTATTMGAGVMSAEDKKVLENLYEEAVKFDTLEVEELGDGIGINYDTFDGNRGSIEIPFATEERAGVMSAEDKIQLNSFNGKIIPITGIEYDNFSGNGTQNSEVTHHLVAGKKYTITAILKRYNESNPVYLQFLNRSDDSFAFGGLVLNSQTTEAVKEYTPTKDLDVYIQYYTGYAYSIAEVRIESVSELEETKNTAELVWDSVLNLANRIDNSFISKTGVLSKTAKDISVFTIDGSLFKKIKAYVAADSASALFIAFYNSETVSADTMISNIVSTNAVLWVEADVPEGCKLIAVSNMNSILEEPLIYGVTDAAKGILDTRENVSVNTNTLKAFDPQQTLLCSNYLYTNAGTENAVSRIYYLTEQDNETIKGAFITGMLVNVLGTGTLSLYLADNIELSTRTETFIEDINVTELGVQVIRFSNPVVVGVKQTFGFKLGFKHAVSTTYGASGYMGVRYLNNDSLTFSNKDFGFGLVGMKKYESADGFSVTRGILGSFVNRINPYYDHLFIDKINKGVANDDIIIPSESIYSVAISKRLGFDMLELNVNVTSDGAFFVFHGDGGKFGPQFEHIDGVTDISAVAVNSVTLEWVKSNVRYKSKYPKYRTAPSTLEEMLHECKRNGIVPFVQKKDTNVTGTWVSSIDSADRIMGIGNYVSYGGGPNARETSAPICYFGSENSVEEILAVCNKYGAPFIYAINNVTKFSDDELKNIVDTLHNKGYFVGFAGSYQNEPLNQKLLNMGFDVSASGWNVPIFTDSNIMCADSFDQFAHNGTVNDGELTLSVGNSVSIAHSGSVPFLSVGLLQIRFTGKLNINMGDYINNEFVSNGDSAMTLTTYYMEKAPVFSITAVEDTEIKEILFKSSKR